MCIYVLRKDEDVIKIRESEIQSLEYAKDQGLKIGRGLSQTERAFVEFELAQRCGERGLLLGFRHKSHMVVAHGDV